MKKAVLNLTGNPKPYKLNPKVFCLRGKFEVQVLQVGFPDLRTEVLCLLVKSLPTVGLGFRI